MNNPEALLHVKMLAMSEVARLREVFRQYIADGQKMNSAPVAYIASEMSKARDVVDWCDRMLRQCE